MLIHGDCLTEMRKLSKVDLILTSPPYNMNLRIRNGEYIRKTDKDFSTKYDSFSDDLSMKDFYSFNKKVIQECLKLSDLVFYNVQFITGNKSALFKLIGDFAHVLKEFIVWDKGYGQPAMKEKVLNSQFEVILVFQNSHPEARLFECGNWKRGTLSNLWKIKRERSVIKSHKAVFPIELSDLIVENFTNEGSVVLDPFMGTGTVGVSCKLLKRKFIGIEINKQYFDISEERIRRARKQLSFIM